jgi:transcription elongation GreA/GreB family factor
MRVIFDVAEIPESPDAGQEDETLSADSPLGLALAGHQPGDTISYETPQGAQRVQLLLGEVASAAVSSPDFVVRT